MFISELFIITWQEKLCTIFIPVSRGITLKMCSDLESECLSSLPHLTIVIPLLCIVLYHVYSVYTNKSLTHVLHLCSISSVVYKLRNKLLYS